MMNENLEDDRTYTQDEYEEAVEAARREGWEAGYNEGYDEGEARGYEMGLAEATP